MIRKIFLFALLISMNISVASASVVPLSHESVESFHNKVCENVRLISKNSITFSNLILLDKRHRQIILNEKLMLHYYAGTIKPKGILTYYTDVQGRVVSIVATDIRNIGKMYYPVLNCVFRSFLYALDLDEQEMSEFAEILTNRMKKSSNGYATEGYWSNKKNRCIIADWYIDKNKDSVSLAIGASDTMFTSKWGLGLMYRMGTW